MITGARFALFTTIVKVSLTVSDSSETLNVTTPDVKTPSTGVQVTKPDSETIIPTGVPDNSYVNSVLSTSVTVTWYWYSTSSVAANTATDVISGASFTGVTVIFKDCVSVNSPSDTLKTAGITPTTPSNGVHMTTPDSLTVIPSGPETKDQVKASLSASVAEAL